MVACKWLPSDFAFDLVFTGVRLAVDAVLFTDELPLHTVTVVL